MGQRPKEDGIIVNSAIPTLSARKMATDRGAASESRRQLEIGKGQKGVNTRQIRIF
nr:hypothetical protein Iba_contig3533CG0010 [Ipomoea batatas]GME16857.1 hypothetical protein Iba_scaffold17873CG0010 [Ipomoea batatas]